MSVSCLRKDVHSHQHSGSTRTRTLPECSHELCRAQSLISGARSEHFTLSAFCAAHARETTPVRHRARLPALSALSGARNTGRCRLSTSAWVPSGCRKPRGSSSVRTRRKSNAIACGEDTRTPFAFSCSAVFDSRAGRGRGPFGIESLCLKGAGALPRPGLVMSAREAQPQADTDSTAMRHRLPCGTGLAVNKKTVQILTDKCKVRGMCDGAGASSWREGERVRNREKGSESEERDAQG